MAKKKVRVIGRADFNVWNVWIERLQTEYKVYDLSRWNGNKPLKPHILIEDKNEKTVRRFKENTIGKSRTQAQKFLAKRMGVDRVVLTTSASEWLKKNRNDKIHEYVD